jgi:hypothetical protein
MALLVAHTYRAFQSLLGREVFGTDFAFARKEEPSRERRRALSRFG